MAHEPATSYASEFLALGTSPRHGIWDNPRTAQTTRRERVSSSSWNVLKVSVSALR